jgi:hypothetical protein
MASWYETYVKGNEVKLAVAGVAVAGMVYVLNTWESEPVDWDYEYEKLKKSRRRL